MPDSLERTPFTAEAIKRRGKTFLGIDKGTAIKAFFGGNALSAIIVLALITIFLFREGIEFFPQYARSMHVYRASGQEMVGLTKSPLDDYDKLQRELTQVQTAVLTRLYDQGMAFEEVNAATGPFRDFIASLNATAGPLKKLVREGVSITRDAKEKYLLHETRRGIEGEDLSKWMTKAEADAYLEQERAKIVAMRPALLEATSQFQEGLAVALRSPPTLSNPDDQLALEVYLESAAAFIESTRTLEQRLADYNPDRSYNIWHSIVGFIFGRQWLTASSWQDFYGIGPLLSGSMLVTLVALLWAIPLGIFSAIYVNQVATPVEQNFIKPYIEFISAIPSVVIGFFGIAVFGQGIRLLSQQDWMAWVPFFPISERLNAFTAGCLLALMAVPTIFTLAEDAINNVPVAFKEASVAMGATRWQTIWRIVIPSSLSGIISAVLLGFGRVIGETMVVLLCAGNRIAIPDPRHGAGVFFEPVHTMTGIIAQEMGEVVPGSIHYRALFVVGIFLFFLSLLVNYLSQRIVKKYKISES